MTELSVGDVIYTYTYPFLYSPEKSEAIVNIKEHPRVIKDIIVSTNSKGERKVTYFDGYYYYNSKRVGTKPICTEDALKRIKRYIKYKSKFSCCTLVCGNLIRL